MSPVRTLERPAPGAATPVYLALKDGLRRFVARRVHPGHVEDLVQDIMLRMHERAADLRDDARVPGWAFRIAQSVVADHHRAKKYGAEASSGSAVAADELPDPKDEAGNVNEVVAGWLGPLLGLLPDEYGEAVQLVDVQGLTHKEYAERAGLSLSGAKSRVQRGRRMIEEMVRACCDLEVDARGNVIGYERRACHCVAEDKG
jgi:RNA polymerase sigma-70 factor (ECF subfamily)